MSKLTKWTSFHERRKHRRLKKENTDRIFLNNMGYDTDPETLAALFKKPKEN